MNTTVVKFISGNKKKFEEVSAILTKALPDLEVIQLKMDIPELQGTPSEIVTHKLAWALEKEEGPLIIEDTSLCFTALNELPGPYIKDFVSMVGCEGLSKMLDGFEDKSAHAQCIFGYGTTKGGETHQFVGRTKGTIVRPQGDNAFGWDPIFMPDDFDKTFAELDSTVKNTISHRYKALEQFIEFIKEGN